MDRPALAAWGEPSDEQREPAGHDSSQARARPISRVIPFIVVAAIAELPALLPPGLANSRDLWAGTALLFVAVALLTRLPGAFNQTVVSSPALIR